MSEVVFVTDLTYHPALDKEGVTRTPERQDMIITLEGREGSFPTIEAHHAYKERVARGKLEDARRNFESREKLRKECGITI